MMSIVEKIWNGLIQIVSSVGLERLQSRQEMAPLALWVGLQLVIIVLLIFAFRALRKTWFGVMFELFVEKIYEFFEEILEETGKRWIKIYVVTLFFIILISNLSAWILDMIRMVFSNVEALTEMITIPTASFEFNIAVALVSILLFLFAQFKHLWIWKFFYEYLPIGGKWILDIDRGNMKAIVYRPAKIVIKTFDILISMFVWILDIVGIAAKVVSLSARLYGNMIAGGILLTLLVSGLNSMTQWMFGHNFPVLGSLILYVQGLLVAVIQAFVFPLLVGIFMKLAQPSED